MKPVQTPLPLTPLIAIAFGTVLWVSGWALPFSVTIDREAFEPIAFASPQIAPNDPLTYHDRTASAEAFQTLINRSPLAQDRSAFSRDPLPNSAPPQIQYEPQFVGLAGRGDDRRALIIWTPGQSPAEVRLGDDTPWGRLDALSANELRFVEGVSVRTLALY